MQYGGYAGRQLFLGMFHDKQLSDECQGCVIVMVSPGDGSVLSCVEACVVFTITIVMVA